VFDDPGANRILVHIAERRLQMGCVKRKRGEALLPEMSGPAAPGIDELGKVSVHRAKEPCQRIGVVRHDDQVDVIRHQAVSPDCDTGCSGALSKERAVEPVIPFSEEDRLAAGAALCDVVGQAGNDDARNSRHASQDGIDVCFPSPCTAVPRISGFGELSPN
jgi:hypothetical protein